MDTHIYLATSNDNNIIISNDNCCTGQLSTSLTEPWTSAM